MILNRETPQYAYQITAYDAVSFTVNGVRHAKSLIVTPEVLVEDWQNAGFPALEIGDIERIGSLNPSLVLLGTGQRQHFPASALLRPLIEAGIVVEVMDSGSACRTFNLLAGEGRAVAAALLLEVAP
jgi:uncharacterized protein